MLTFKKNPDFSVTAFFGANPIQTFSRSEWSSVLGALARGD